MPASPTYLSEYRINNRSRSQKLKESLSHPVIDSDVHSSEFMPLLGDYIERFSSAKMVDAVRNTFTKGYSAGKNWHQQTPAQRDYEHTMRPPWWGVPTSNTLDLATASQPRLLYERLGELGTDFAVVFPNACIVAPMIGDPEMREVLVKAVNTYNADLYRPYSDRIAAVAAIPLQTPQEGMESLKYAVKELGLKVALIPGYAKRPIEAVQARYPAPYHPYVTSNATWLDFFGMDSKFDYDPFWKLVIDLGVPLTTHTGALGWDARHSRSSYTFNHLGHLAEAGHALAKALFLGGVTRRFPKLRLAFLEGGGGWGAQLYTDLVGHWEKRGKEQVQLYNPMALDKQLLVRLYREYGDDLFNGRNFTDAEILEAAAAAQFSPIDRDGQVEKPEEQDEFAAAGIGSPEDIRDSFVPNFYFGAEADDPTVAYAFNTKVNPLSVTINAFWGSDAGHWDVPNMSDLLASTWDLVEKGTLTESQVRALTFDHPYKFYTEANPQFFRGTVIERKLTGDTAA